MEEDYDPVINLLKRARRRTSDTDDSDDSDEEEPSDVEEDIDAIMVVDSGADEHLTRDEEILTLKRSKTCVPNLRAANGTPIAATAVGKINGNIDNVLVTPSVEESLLSVDKLLKTYITELNRTQQSF
jgi:hypothetical protein